MTAAPIPVRSIVLLSIAAFASSATIRIADPLLPQIAGEFGTTVAHASIISTACTLAYGLCQLVHGPVGDRFGKYTIITLMTLASALMTGAGGFANDLATLGFLRLLAGATAAALIPLSMAHIGDIVPLEQRQPVLARFMSGQILGSIAGQAMGGIFGEYLSWHAVFMVLGVVYLGVAFLLWRELLSGRVVQTRTAVSPSFLVTTLLTLARTPRVRLVVGVVFLEGVSFLGPYTYLSTYLHDRFSLGFAAIGAILGCFGLGGLVYAALAGRIVASLGPRNMVVSGGFLMALAYGLCLLVPAWWIVPLSTTLCGVGFYLFHNTLQTQATQMAPHVRGIAVSLFASGFFLGQSVGVALGGLVVTDIGYGPILAFPVVTLPLLAVFFRRRMGLEQQI